MKCADWQELILDREQLEPGELRELDQHLANCDVCSVWAKALAEIEADLTTQLRAELDASVLRARILRAVARERNWMKKEVPELLDALGWNALAVLAMAGLFLWSGWQGWHLWLAGAATLVGSLAWAGRVLWKDQSESRRFL